MKRKAAFRFTPEQRREVAARLRHMDDMGELPSLRWATESVGRIDPVGIVTQMVTLPVDSDAVERVASAIESETAGRNGSVPSQVALRWAEDLRAIAGHR